MTQTITKDGRRYRLVPIDETEQTPYRLTVSKHFDFEVYPHDLPETMTWVKAKKYIENSLPDWRMPTKEELLQMYENKDKIGGFYTKGEGGSDFPDWYWSSTEYRGNPDYVCNVRFSDGIDNWSHKDYGRLSCRPVRLVAATPSPVGEASA